MLGNLLPWPKKNRYSRDIHEIDPQCDHEISCDIDFDLQRELVTRRAAGRVDVEPKLDIARFHMIEMLINLMNFSAVTIVFGQDSMYTFVILWSAFPSMTYTYLFHGL